MLKGCHQKLWVRRLRTKQKQGVPLNRTHPANSHRRYRYVQQGVPQWELPVFRCLHDEPALPAMQQILFALPRCFSRQGWPDRMPVPDGR